MSAKELIIKSKEWLLYAIAFFLAGYIHAVPLVIIAFVAVWLAGGDIKAKLTAWAHNKYALLLVGFYFLHLVGMLYTGDTKEGWFDLEVKLSLFLFPVILSYEGLLEAKKQKGIIMAFLAGLSVNGLICLIYAVWRLIVLNQFEFQYSQFSLFLHPSYYSMYIDLGVVFIFYLLTERKIEKNKTEKIFLYSVFFFLEFIIVLLQSKAGLIVSGLVIVVSVFRYLMRESPIVKTISLVLGIVALYALAYHYIITSGRSRILFAEDVMSRQISDTATESTQVRLYVWKAGMEVIKKVPFTGTGTGAARGELVKQYEKDNMIGALKKKLNAHNQYIQYAVEFGIPGFLFFLATLFIPLYKAVKEKRFVYIMFLCILMINLLVESMFETQAGSIFYGLFNSLLMFNFVI